ncbi:hypothetical protein F895_03027 [Acinetobacter sp. CIP 64.2]|uniref:hypothetical protein n=1 Tax=Acinetobacter TaxID=469 RepID=UPI000289B60B|nr:MULTISPECIES: hypothetical protein [Acinetobacter]ENX12650.1 hypothetical protein F895_03027 [Acinetobacter sp. CIP 64.2]
MSIVIKSNLHNKILSHTENENLILQEALSNFGLFGSLKRYKSYVLMQYNFYYEMIEISSIYDVPRFIPNVKCYDRLKAIKGGCSRFIYYLREL